MSKTNSISEIGISEDHLFVEMGNDGFETACDDDGDHLRNLSALIVLLSVLGLMLSIVIIWYTLFYL